MSFQLTTQQFLDGTKTVTRRLGWKLLKPGDRFRACEKCMGLRKGEKVKVLGVCEVVSVRREPLHAITRGDVRREGFRHMDRGQFIEMFCTHMKCKPSDEVTRIEFRKVDDDE